MPVILNFLTESTSLNVAAAEVLFRAEGLNEFQCDLTEIIKLEEP